MQTGHSSLNSSNSQQTNLSDGMHDQNNTIFNYSNLPFQQRDDHKSLLNFYEVAYAAAAQARHVSSLHPSISPNQSNLNSTDASTVFAIARVGQLPPVFGLDSISPIADIPYSSNNNPLYCECASDRRWTAHVVPEDHNATWANPCGNIGKPSLDLNSARRNRTSEGKNILKTWLQEHINYPYPTREEKIMLAICTKLTLTQLKNWFYNARHQLKKRNKMPRSLEYRCSHSTSTGGETDTSCKDALSDDNLKTGGQLDAVFGQNDFTMPTNFSLNLKDEQPKICSLANTSIDGWFSMPLQSSPSHSRDGASEDHPNNSNNNI